MSFETSTKHTPKQQAFAQGHAADALAPAPAGDSSSPQPQPSTNQPQLQPKQKGCLPGAPNANGKGLIVIWAEGVLVRSWHALGVCCAAGALQCTPPRQQESLPMQLHRMGCCCSSSEGFLWCLAAAADSWKASFAHHCCSRAAPCGAGRCNACMAPRQGWPGRDAHSGAHRQGPLITAADACALHRQQ